MSTRANILVKKTDYVKIDVGVHVDGYIGDTARTVRIAGKDDLIKCSEKMLKEAADKAKYTISSKVFKMLETASVVARSRHEREDGKGF